MDFVGYHTRDGCLVCGPDLRGACPVQIVLTTGESKHVGAPVEEAIYHFLHHEYGWQPRRLEELVTSGQQDRVVLPHSCGEFSFVNVTRGTFVTAAMAVGYAI